MLTFEAPGEFALTQHQINFGVFRPFPLKAQTVQCMIGWLCSEREVTHAWPDAGLAAFVPSHH